MRAVEFNWLTKVDDIEYDKANNIVRFSLSLGDEYVDAQVTPTCSTGIDIVSLNDYIPVRIPQLNPTDICIVGAYDQVHAISGMPFTLTAYQFHDLNTFLYEHIEETKKWLI